MRRLLVTFVVLVLSLTPGAVVAAEDAPPPGPPYPDPIRGVAVYDHAGILDEDTVESLEATIDAIEERTGAEIVFYSQVKPESDTVEDAERDAIALIDQWGIGRKGFDDGMVILFDMRLDLCHGQVQLYAGPGYRAAYLTNDERQAIFDEVMLPYLRECDVDAAVLAAMERIDSATVMWTASPGPGLPWASSGGMTLMGPVVLGGRIEVPSAGLALSVPEGWYALDITDPGLSAAMEAFDTTTALLAHTVAAAGPRFDRITGDPPSSAEAVRLVMMLLTTAGEVCSVGQTRPASGVSLDDFVRGYAASVERDPDNRLLDGPSAIVLPAGDARFLSYERARGEATDTFAAFIVSNDGIVSMLCGAEDPPEDRWLSIAQTLEFLPPGE